MSEDQPRQRRNNRWNHFQDPTPPPPNAPQLPPWNPHMPNQMGDQRQLLPPRQQEMNNMDPQNPNNQPGRMDQYPPHFFPNPPPPLLQEPPLNPYQLHNAAEGFQPPEYETENVQHLAFAEEYVLSDMQQNPVLPYPQQLIPLAQVPDDQLMRPDVGIQEPNHYQDIQERQPPPPLQRHFSGDFDPPSFSPRDDTVANNELLLNALQYEFSDEHQVEPRNDVHQEMNFDVRNVPAEINAQAKETPGDAENNEHLLAGPSSTSQHSTSPHKSSRQNQALGYVEQLNKMHEKLNTKDIAKKFIRLEERLKYSEKRTQVATTIHTDLDYFNDQIIEPVVYSKMNNTQKVMYSRLYNLMSHGGHDGFVTIVELYKEMEEAWTQNPRTKKCGGKYAHNVGASNHSNESVSREEALKVVKQLDEPTKSVDTRDVAKKIKRLISNGLINETPTALMIGVDRRGFKKHFIDIEDPIEFSEMKGAQQNIFRRLHNWLICDDAERRKIVKMSNELVNARGKDTKKWKNSTLRKLQVQPKPDDKSISLVKVTQTYIPPLISAESEHDRALEIVEKLSKSLEEGETIDKKYLTEQFYYWADQKNYSKLRDTLGLVTNYQLGTAITKFANKYQRMACLRFHNWLKDDEKEAMLEYHEEVRKVWKDEQKLIKTEKSRGMEEEEPLAKKRKTNDSP